MRPIVTEFGKSYIKVLAVLILLLGIFGFFHRAGAQSTELRDCDANAVIRCGALSTSELTDKYQANSGNTKAIYAAMGIPTSVSFSGMVEGTVTRDGRVLVGNKVVATDAVTAGRVDMPGSTPIAAGLAFKRPPSVSFAAGHDSLPALVSMDNQGFRFAVIKSCGNPVMAKTVAKPARPSPSFTVTKRVRLQGSNSDFMQGITVNQHDAVEFLITINNTGNTSLNNIRFHDILPTGLTFTPAVVLIDDKASPNNALGNDIDLGALAPGSSRRILFRAVVDGGVQACDSNRLRNVVTVKPNQLPAKQASASVQVCPQQVLSSVTPVATSPQPTTLTNSGISTPMMIAIFGVVSTVATYGYRWLMSRRARTY